MEWIDDNIFFVMSAILGSLAVIVLMAIMIVTFSLITERRRILAHVDTAKGTEANEARLLSTTFFALASPLTNLLKKSKLYNKKMYDKKYKKLKDGGFKITPYEMLSVKTVFAFIGIILSLFVMFRDFTNSNEIFLLIIVPLTAFFAPNLYVWFRAGAKIKIIKKDFVVAIKILSNSMQGGYSIPQAMKSVSKTLKGPMAHEFERMYKEIELGFSIEESLKAFSERVRIDQTKMLATIISINNTVGGNVVEAFHNAIESIEVTNRIQTKVRVATASARSSLKIVGSIPIVLFFVITLVTGGEYFVVFIETPIGWGMLGGAILLQLTGIIVIRKMSRIDI